ncbi:SecY-interacting protein [Shewanella sp. AS16]|uniref:SecY-interacting protein n=1 Tax=Shewanella sp. AS16 TaxID=2907625 RepID=UPI001F44A8D6|nr:SecY-interacting protein [Shewanella sp. AS16]MCE9685123.1 SecY-interacting protein [Shewanella sp. AS16]
MSCLPALDDFLQNYLQAYRERLDEYPRYYPLGEASVCIRGDFEPEANVAVFWAPVRRDVPGRFDNVAGALGLTLWPDINDFYGYFFAASLLFDSPWGEGELLQPWNDKDFDYLQQNIIGHLMMKQKLKQAPTWFVGVLNEGDKMLTVDNADGSVWLEIPGEAPSERLAPSLEAFIGQLSARVAPPSLHQEPEMPALAHPGIGQRLQAMWQHLFGKRG